MGLGLRIVIYMAWPFCPNPYIRAGPTAIIWCRTRGLGPCTQPNLGVVCAADRGDAVFVNERVYVVLGKYVNYSVG
jgi:hypothetical protein